MTPARPCPICGAPLEPDDRFCPLCGQTTGRILWSSSLTAQPGDGITILPAGETLYIVANNVGGDAVPVRIDTTRLRGLSPVGRTEARAEPRQTVAFALQHQPDTTPAGIVALISEDGPRPHPAAQNPNGHWWERRAERQEQWRAQEFVRVAADSWVVGSPTLLFPPGVRRQYVRVWNDSDRARAFASDVPMGYKITNVTMPIEKKAPDLSPRGSVELVAEALLVRGPQEVDREWLAGPEAEPVPIRRLSAASGEAGADVIIAIDFGTRNTGVRVRWRHELFAGKPKGAVNIIGDRDGNARFPTEMALHRNGRSFRWGSEVPKGRLAKDEIRISRLKTLLRVNEEPYRKENPNWTNAYLLERYFEQIFIRIDEYFKTVDPSLSRHNLSVRYVLTRPVLDANEDDAQGKRYQSALTMALDTCGVTADQITFVHEPVAAAYGIARRRANALLALGEGTAIAVVDAGGGTTDVALARVSLRDGRVALDIRGTYALHLDAANPALPAVQRFGDNDRLEFGGDVLDYALTYRLLTDSAAILETEGRPIPPRLEEQVAPVVTEERRIREQELVFHCRTMKEAFAYVSTHHLTRSADQPVREHEHFIFANRPEYEGIYLEQSLFGDNVIAPILRAPLQALRESMEQDSFRQQGIRPSQVKHVFYVGGTNIEFYLRQQIQEAFPNSPRLQAEGREGVEERIAERLNAVVEGAVWCDEVLFASSPLTLALNLGEERRPLMQFGDPLPPETASILRPFPVRLEPFEALEATLTATGAAIAEPIPVVRGFYRNTSDTVQEGTLQVRISREKGVTAALIINNRTYDQWRFALVESP